LRRGRLKIAEVHARNIAATTVLTVQREKNSSDNKNKSAVRVKLAARARRADADEAL
jgi:hypothetical protein